MSHQRPRHMSRVGWAKGCCRRERVRSGGEHVGKVLNITPISTCAEQSDSPTCRGKWRGRGHCPYKYPLTMPPRKVFAKVPGGRLWQTPQPGDGMEYPAWCTLCGSLSPG